MKLLGKIRLIAKKYRFLYIIYFYLFSSIIKILKLFIRTDDEMVVFLSFSGKKFDDSPRAIYEGMIKDERFSHVKVIWIFENPEKFTLNCRKVKIDSLVYYYYILKARCWITNVAMERGLDFKGERTFYLNTWHGIPIKKIGTDVKSKNGAFVTRQEKWNVDLFLAQSDYDADIYSRVFNISQERIKKTGMPRNDILLKNDCNIQLLKSKLNLPLNKKIILYAPTFREFNSDYVGEYIFENPIHVNKWREKLANDYVIIFRAHSSISKLMGITDDDFMYDFSIYPQLTDLMLVSDLLISDYSSLLFDYSILEKPMFCFAYDYEEYMGKRGIYIDLETDFPNSFAKNEDDLLALIVSSDEKTVKDALSIKQKYMKNLCNSTSVVLNIVYDVIYGQ